MKAKFCSLYYERRGNFYVSLRKWHIAGGYTDKVLVISRVRKPSELNSEVVYSEYIPEYVPDSQAIRLAVKKFDQITEEPGDEDQNR